MHKPELLAPAGNFEKLKIALHYGADAVYASTPSFSMRTREISFTYKTLKSAIEYTHKLNKKIYITLNTYPHASEIKKWQTHARKIINLKPDALIVADIGLIKYIQSISSIPIHLSTQANTTNQLSAKFWFDQGIKRVVLAREMNLKDIKLISKIKGLKIESFVHGAMCMAYSGRCQISNYLIGRDPNKGECIQPCRFKYKLYGVEEGMRKNEIFPVLENESGTFLFNSKDLCMIENIADLIKAGISAFKIEGRMKSTYYVGSVVRLYREAIDLYCKNPEEFKNSITYFTSEMQKINNRGYTTGFYFNKPDQNTNNYETSKEVSTFGYVGIVESYDKINKIAKILVKNYLPVGSMLEILTPNKIVIHKLDKIKIGKKFVNVVHANSVIEIETSENIPVNSLIRTQNL